jgi:hypothetical protein
MLNNNMKTYVINSIEDLKQFENNGKYIVDGNLEAYCSLNFNKLNKNLIVKGNLFIKSKEYIEVCGYIDVIGTIKE